MERKETYNDDTLTKLVTEKYALIEDLNGLNDKIQPLLDEREVGMIKLDLLKLKIVELVERLSADDRGEFELAATTVPEEDGVSVTFMDLLESNKKAILKKLEQDREANVQNIKDKEKELKEKQKEFDEKHK